MPFTNLPNAKEGKRFICIYLPIVVNVYDADDVIDINIIEDPTYKVAAD
jgi:hypothetical protein